MISSHPRTNNSTVDPKIGTNNPTNDNGMEAEVTLTRAGARKAPADHVRWTDRVTSARLHYTHITTRGHHTPGGKKRKPRTARRTDHTKTWHDPSQAARAAKTKALSRRKTPHDDAEPLATQR